MTLTSKFSAPSSVHEPKDSWWTDDDAPPIGEYENLAESADTRWQQIDSWALSIIASSFSHPTKSARSQWPGWQLKYLGLSWIITTLTRLPARDFSLPSDHPFRPPRLLLSSKTPTDNCGSGPLQMRM
ncbi:hypothetical protein DCS_01538 [Drechmeria coniospora]|uniref:Uncharacterized protein n=1 Tax=Drechmeria coniospora TaxID=98403 RepID=A0A151GTK2_DRECN|nr:hypothetical protein DCS_01538 [Drechmeria coniospora]KYK60401.1 hypothetical protein DCS_01538 [Drechmeria coniospora]